MSDLINKLNSLLREMDDKILASDIARTTIKIAVQEKSALLDRLIKQVEMYETGMSYSTPKARYENSIEKAIPLTALIAEKDKLK